jgi:hypothetical protein
VKLGIILLILVSIRHNGSIWLSDFTGITQKGVFYVLGGAWEAVLCFVLASYLWKQREHIGVFACVIGASEGIQMAVCRLLQSPTSGNLCDAYFGLPVGATFVSMYALCLSWYVGRSKMNSSSLIIVPIIAAAEVSYLTQSIPVGLGLLALCFATWGLYGSRA